MKKQTKTFESLLRSFEYRYDLRTVFDDFLTLTLCAFSQNPLTGKSYDEDLYMETIDKYREDPLRHHFPKMLAFLLSEMEERVDDSSGNDVLGNFYQEHLYRKGAAQFFTPWPVCQLIANISINTDEKEIETERRLRVLDPCSGAKLRGTLLYAYYGIDLDHTCVKMTALNLFLNGVFHGEVMWADALRPDDFRMSYKLSFLPFGIFRITEKEKSLLWYLHVSGFPTAYKADFKNEQWNSERKNDDSESNSASQLNLF
jgi:type I restriction-modification system DNA methylase subunit